MTALKNALAVNDGKAVVISIKREWLAKIMSGEKTLEVRKSRPWKSRFHSLYSAMRQRQTAVQGKSSGPLPARTSTS